MSYLEEVKLDERTFSPFAQWQQQFGFIPNLFKAQTLRPDLIEAEAALAGTILLKEGALSRAQKEYVFLVCSAANLSTYCVTAHCEMIKMLGLKGPEPEQIAVDHNETDLSAADKALLDFVLKLTRHGKKVGPADFVPLRSHAFTDPQILEAIAVTALAKFANLLSHGLGAAPDFEAKELVPVRE
jgi:uncharacterized peroxidase-related enzyme